MLNIGGHALIVPPSGLLEVVHSNGPIDPERLLRTRTSGGEFVRLTTGNITTNWMSQEHGRVNPRARDVFQRISQVHFVFTGPVVFLGIEERLMGDIVGRLSMLETAGGDAV
jgi:hypothetical protein